MTAVFSYDAQTGPQYVDFPAIAAGYGILSVPVGGFLTDDVVQTVALTIEGTGLATIQLAIDMVQRTAGFYEWTDASSIDAHFTITRAQIAAIAAATDCTYSMVIMILRNGVQQTREVQAGSLSARTALPAPPLIVNEVIMSGGPVTGTIGDQAQLTAAAYDGLGNILPYATITWTSSNTNVAIVDATGLVTFIVPGVSTITASSDGVSDTTTATTNDVDFVAASDKQVPAYDFAQSLWGPVTLTAAYLSITLGSLAVGGGWPAGASELAPGAAGGYVRSNGSAWVRAAIAATDVAAGSFANGLYTFPAGLSVNGGTLAAQAITGTTGAFTSTVSSSGFTGPLTGNASTATALATGHTIAITGDLTYTSPTFDGTGNVTAAGTLATVNGDVGSFGSSTAIPTFTVNAKGLITAANTAAVVAPAGTLTGTTLASNVVSSSLTGVGVLASPHMTGAVVDSGGFTVTAGSTSVQAFTATTIHATSTSALDGAVTLGATLVFSTAASQVIPGATSYALRNNANNADNWIVLDAGSGTLRGALAIGGALSGATTGGFSGIITASGLTISAAVGKIIPGATSISLRNNADNADNLLIADAGAITVRSTISGVTTLTATTLTGTLSTVAQPNITSTGVLASLHMTSAVVDSGGLTVTAGGLTVSAGTSAVQAFTGTTGVFSSTLGVTGDFAVATTKFTVAAASGNTAVAGTLGVTGAFNVNSNFTVSTAGALSGITTIATSSTINGQTITSAASFTGSVTVGSGFTVSAGTSAVQALTATTIATTSTLTVSSNSSASVAAGPNGSTNPVWQIDSSTVSQAAGLKLTGAIAAGTVGLAVISSGSNANLSIDGKGSGTITVGGTSTGDTIIGTAVHITSAGAVSGITTLATSSTINSQTISSVASFTGSVTVANGFTVTAGTSALQAVTATTILGTSTLTVSGGGITVTGNSTITGNLSGVATLTATTGTITTLTATTGTITTLNTTNAINANGGVIVDSLAGSTGMISFAASKGLFLQGSTSSGIDLTLANAAGTTVMSLAAASTTATFAGNLVAAGQLQFGARPGVLSQQVKTIANNTTDTFAVRNSSIALLYDNSITATNCLVLCDGALNTVSIIKQTQAGGVDKWTAGAAAGGGFGLTLAGQVLTVENKGGGPSDVFCIMLGDN